MSLCAIAFVGNCGPSSRVASRAAGAARGGGAGGRVPNAATICATFASIVFSVATTLVMRWPVMSWKLHAS